MVAVAALVFLAWSDASPPYAAKPGPRVFYVSASGSDSNPGTSSARGGASPRAAGAETRAGSTVVVRDGTYDEDFTVSSPGAPGAPILFRAAQRHGTSLRSVSVRASHVRLDRFAIGGAPRHCVSIAPGLSDISITHSRIHDCARDGIRFMRPEDTGAAYTHHVRISRNSITRVGLDDSEGNDLTIYRDPVGVLERVVVVALRVRDVVDHVPAVEVPVAPEIDGVVRASRSGCSPACGIGEGPGHSNWRISNNLFWNTGSICWILDTTEGGTHPSHPGLAGMLVYNNTFVRAGRVSTVELNSQTSSKFVNNLLYDTVSNHYEQPRNVTRGFNFYGGSTPRAREPHSLGATPVSSIRPRTSASPRRAARSTRATAAGSSIPRSASTSSATRAPAPSTSAHTNARAGDAGDGAN